VTSISYKLSVKSHVRLYVHEVRTGKAFLLFDGVQSKGTHIVKFDATSLNEGEFIAELITENYTVKKTMHKLSRLSGVTLAN
jgi:hypothetical protein